GKRYSQTVMKNPNFAALAEAYGIRGIRCDHKTDVEKTVKEMVNHKGPVLVDFYVEPNEHVYPMVPSGKGLHEMELGRWRRGHDSWQSSAQTQTNGARST